MASFIKDPTHYAHPLFQSEQLPNPIGKKNKASNKKLPMWMTHTVKQGYTSYLVHTNATTLEPKDYRPPRIVGGLEPAGNQFELLKIPMIWKNSNPANSEDKKLLIYLKRLENNNEKGVKVLKKKLRKIVADYKKKVAHYGIFAG